MERRGSTEQKLLGSKGPLPSLILFAPSVRKLLQKQVSREGLHCSPAGIQPLATLHMWEPLRPCPDVPGLGTYKTELVEVVEAPSLPSFCSEDKSQTGPSWDWVPADGLGHSAPSLHA